jgi:hypothetical protein
VNEALNAVRFAESSSFLDTPRLARAAKRAMMRHLADMANWSCVVDAFFADRQKPACDHRECRWQCFQSEVETADELSVSESAVKRTRRTLVADGWIIVTRASLGRGAVTRYELNREKLSSVARPRREKRCKVPPFLRTDEAEKGSNLHPIHELEGTEGEPPAPGRRAVRTEKGSNVPLLYRKNRNEPEENQSSADALMCVDRKPQQTFEKRPPNFTQGDILAVWAMWPNKGGKHKGCESIEKALSFLANFDLDPVADLKARVRTWLAGHGREVAKMREDRSHFVPPIGFAQGWFGDKQKRYLDDAATPLPEPMLVLPNGEIAPQSATEADGWKALKGAA